jgi:hypothetical protein
VTSLDAFDDLDQHRAVRGLSLPRDFGAPFAPRAAVRAAGSLTCDAVAYQAPFENHPTAVAALARGRASGATRRRCWRACAIRGC